jgi:hypothetical protein
VRREVVQIYGVNAGEHRGNNVMGSYVGRIDGNLDQIDAGEFTQAFIAGGYSGAAVRDAGDNVVGMASGYYNGGPLIAYMIPVATLRTVAAPPPAAPRRRSTIVTIAKERAGNTGDAVTKFCLDAGARLQKALPDTPIKISKHARATEWVPDERYFYLANPASDINLLTKSDLEGWLLSYEFYFAGPSLKDAISYSIALLLDADHDFRMFGEFMCEERIDAYVNALSANPVIRASTDFVRKGPGSCVELGRWRTLTRLPGKGRLEDAPNLDGRGAASVVNDILNLMWVCEPIVTQTVFGYRRP